MATREPSVLDLWRLSGRHTSWYSLPNFPSWMKNPAVGYSAKHFALDEQSRDYLSEMARTQVALIRQLAEFALPPYETLAISMPLPPEGDFPSGDMLLFVRSPADFVGFIHHTDGRADDWTAIPFLHAPVQPDDTSKQTVAAWVLIITAFFLLLHARRVVTVAELPVHRTVRRGRAVAYYSYSKVKIDLTAPKLTRRVFAAGTHATPRRHEVMGHFVHRGGQPGCIHDWQPVVRDPDDGMKRWECVSCDRKRTWRKAFERGDAGKGFVRQEYAVTAKGIT